MFYLPPEEFWYLTATKIAAYFDDNQCGSGTGFLVYDESQYFLVTARHVVDPKYLPPSKKRHANCNKLEIFFQSAVNPGTSSATVAYQGLRVDDPSFCFAINEVDVAAIKIPSDFLPVVNKNKVVRPFSFSINYLATNEDFSFRYAGEPLVFIGYPDNSPHKDIGDSSFYYPLLRQGVFAYPPIHGINIKDQIGNDYGLLDSFAQSGFSGGPIISLQKGWADGSWHPAKEHRPPKLVGLVCGHYRSAQDRSDGVHAGLSYFARSTSIRELIERIQ